MSDVKLRMISSSASERKYPQVQKRKKKKSEFDSILESYRNETAEDLDEYHLLLPERGLFHDNGYEDVYAS